MVWPHPRGRGCVWAKYLLPCCCKPRQLRLSFNLICNMIIFGKSKILAMAQPPKSTPGDWAQGFINQDICRGYSKEPSQWDGSFEHPKHMLKLMGKKIFIILCWFWFVCLFDLILYVPSTMLLPSLNKFFTYLLIYLLTIFQLCRDGSSWVEPVLN